MKHSEWRTRRTRKLLGETVEDSSACTEAGYAFALGQAVYDRRAALGMSQTELARRAGTTHPDNPASGRVLAKAGSTRLGTSDRQTDDGSVPYELYALEYEHLGQPRVRRPGPGHPIRCPYGG
ncbi:hypothetical protein LRE75_16780 [Streptomyces sp. 372A]